MFLFEKNKEVISMYLLYITSLIMNIVPHVTIATFGMCLFFIVFIYTYILRNKHDETTLEHDHYCYQIKTIWIFSLFVFVGIILAYFFADHTIINNVSQSAMSGIIPNEAQIMSMAIDYTHVNKLTFGIIFTPITLHLLYRLGKGMYLARQNRTISNPKSWI